MPARCLPCRLARRPSTKAVTKEGEYSHVRFRDPDDFAEIRTPEWATEVARDVSAGGRVRMGRRSGSDDWAVQSVLVEKHVGRDKAGTQAKRFVEKLEG